MDHTIPRPEQYGIPYASDEYNGMLCLWIGRSGLRASMIGLGTWKLGLPETGDMGPVVPGVTSVAQLESNAQVAAIELDAAQLAAVRYAVA